MIEKMSKLNLFLFHADKQSALLKLQSLGTIDLDLQKVDNEVLQENRKTKEQLNYFLNQVEKFYKKYKKSKFAIPLNQREFPHDAKAQTQILTALNLKHHQLQESLHELESDLLRALPWGNITIEKVIELKKNGIDLDLYTGSKKFFDTYDFSNLTIEIIDQNKTIVRFAAIFRHGESYSLPFEKFDIPSRSLEELKREKEIVLHEILKTELELAALHAHKNKLEHAVKSVSTRISFEEAKASLKQNHDGVIFFITGYFPTAHLNELKDFLEKGNFSYEIDAPAINDDVPVLLKNRPFFKIFEPITKIFSLPSYRELDPTPLFAPFFIIFFGLCLGDAGYGVITLLLSIVFLFNKSIARFAKLGIILSLATIMAGLFTNSFFGEKLFQVGETGFFNAGSEVAIFAATTIDGQTVYPAMTLALALGFLQICTAFIIQAINRIKLYGFIYAVKSFALLAIIVAAFILAAHSNFLNLGFNRAFAIGPFKIGQVFTNVPELYALWVLGIATFAFILLNSPQVRLIFNPLTAIWEFYQFVTGFLGDFLSYIRLFALGLASGLLANAFNQIAFMILPKDGNGYDYTSVMMVFTVLILIFGHSLNLALAALGSFVHPLRLTFVEFYKNIEFQGSGRVYTPFEAKIQE